MIEAFGVSSGETKKFEPAYNNVFPNLYDVRRVPGRYQRKLPLAVIKSHQCVVLGATSHILTVGIVGSKNDALLRFLQTLTGTAIFPVLVEPERMRLLIARIERYQHFRQRFSGAYYVLQLPYQVRQFLRLRGSASA